MTTQVYLVFTMTTLHNYIQDHTIEKIDYFKEGIDKKMILVFTFDNVSLGTSLATFACMNRKRDIIANKM